VSMLQFEPYYLSWFFPVQNCTNMFGRGNSICD
jgi:hypothetical protein